MSLFEKIKNKKYNLIEAQDQQKRSKNKNQSGPNFSQTSSRTGSMKGGKNDPLKQKAEAEYVKYTDELAKKSGITGKNPGKKLEKQVDTGLKKQDGTIGKRTPNKGYAQGEPFQGNTNVRDKTGKYPASGRSTLKGRQRYQFDIAKTSRKDAAKARLVTRIKKVEDPFFADKGGTQDVKKITKYVDDITKNQTLSKGKGTKSSLFKTLKSYTDAKNPTVQGGGKPARFVKGKDGVVRQYGGGKLPMSDGSKRDAKVKANLQKFDDKITKQAKLPKGTYIPKGGVFPKSDIKTKKTIDKLSVPFEPKETNIQYKSDKLDLDYGKRFAQRDGLTDAERKRKLKKLQRDLNIKNPTITSPKTGGQLPATKSNLRKYGLLDGGFKKQNFKKTFTSSGSGGQKSFSIPKTKPTSRFGRMMTALKKNPKTAAAALAIGTGVYLYNKGKNSPKGIVPPVAGGGKKIKSAKGVDINFTLGGKGGYGGSAGRTSKGAD